MHAASLGGTKRERGNEGGAHKGREEPEQQDGGGGERHGRTREGERGRGEKKQRKGERRGRYHQNLVFSKDIVHHKSRVVNV